jgi:hypothetical protein
LSFLNDAQVDPFDTREAVDALGARRFAKAVELVGVVPTSRYAVEVLPVGGTRSPGVRPRSSISGLIESPATNVDSSA